MTSYVIISAHDLCAENLLTSLVRIEPVLLMLSTQRLVLHAAQRPGSSRLAVFIASSK
jgi:hypothetical protein